MILFFVNHFGFAQTDTENQFRNQFQIHRTIGNKTALEIDIGTSFRSGTEETNPFYKNSQESYGLWIHYFAGKKWKLSAMAGFVFNRSVPEINQKKLPELRFSFQSIYYFIRSKELTLTSRTRIEDRILGDANTNSIEINYRFRQMIKLVYPLTSTKLGKGTLYGVASEEVFFKTEGVILGDEFFDRNQLLLGFGYTFTDHFQVELNYINEYLPRAETDKLHHIISTKIILNDFITVLKKRLGSIPSY